MRASIFLTCFIKLSLTCAEYSANFIGTESLSTVCSACFDMNNEEQFSGVSDSKILFIDKNNGIYFLDKKDIKDSNGNSLGIYDYFGNTLINNDEKLVCSCSRGSFTFDKKSGIQWIKGIHNVIAVNDFDQIIAETNSSPRRPCLWNNGEIIDMGLGSELSQQIEYHGYHVMNINLKAINNNGEIAGTFEYGKFNEKNKKWYQIGSQPFFWNGYAHIISISGISLHGATVKLNNQGVVMIPSWDNNEVKTFLWDIHNGLQQIRGFSGSDLNDTGWILGRMVIGKDDHGEDKYAEALWRDGMATSLEELLSIKDLDNLSPRYSDSYSIERIYNFRKINNKGHILCDGQLWGEAHPCILMPKKLTPKH